MRLAAAEVRLKLNDRITALPGEPSDCADQHLIQAMGQIGAAEELGRFPIFVGALAEVYLPQIGRELCLLVAPARHILMRSHNLPPGFQTGARLAFNRGARTPSLFAADLF